MYKAKFNRKIQIIQLSVAQREALWLFAGMGTKLNQFGN